MKKIILSLVILFAGISASQAQEIQTSKAINVHFFSSASLEDIEATTQNGTSVITTSKNEFFFLVPIKSFTFKSSLMQEHFNENYMESDKYADARFSGKVNEDIDWKKDGVNNVTVTGKLNIHGVEQDRTISGKVIIKNGTIQLISEFKVRNVDHNIQIPKLVVAKIAEAIEVKVDCILMPKK